MVDRVAVVLPITRFVEGNQLAVDVYVRSGSEAVVPDSLEWMLVNLSVETVVSDWTEIAAASTSFQINPGYNVVLDDDNDSEKFQLLVAANRGRADETKAVAHYVVENAVGYVSVPVEEVEPLPDPFEPLSDLVAIPLAGGTTATLTMSTDVGAGKVYIVIVPSGSAAPTGEQIEAGTDGDDVAATWSGSLDMGTIDSFLVGPSGLTALTAYDVYATQKYDGEYSIVQSTSFTTLSS